MAPKRLQWGRGCEPADSYHHDPAGNDILTLQWGRGCEPADSLRVRRSLSGSTELQWGRGCEPADSSDVALVSITGNRSFNGAAGVNPRIENLSP